MKPVQTFAVILLVGLFNTANAQPFSFEKYYSHDVMSFDGVAHVLSNDSVNIFIAGNAAIGVTGDGETVALKLDGSGNIVRSLIMGKPDYHDVCTAAIKNGHDIHLAGYTRSTDTSASPLFTSFLVHADNDLNVTGQDNFIFSGNDLYFKTADTAAGGSFLFAGNNYEFASGIWHTFVMKTTQNGNVLFCKMSDSFLSLDPGFITELSNHDILLTGSVTLGFEQVMPVVARFDSLGNMRWAKVFDYDPGSVQQSKLIFAKELPSGNILLAGHSDYTGAANLGLMDFQVFKIDSGGTTLMMKTFGGGQIDWLYGATYDIHANELLLLGTSASFTSNNSFYGLCIATDTSGFVTNALIQGDTAAAANGLVLYNAARLSSGSTVFSGADVNGTAGFYAAKFNTGYFGSSSCHSYSITTASTTAVYPEFSYTATPFPFDVNIQINHIPFDYYSGVPDSLVCYEDVASVEQDDDQKKMITVFPNPASDKFTVTAADQSELNIAVYNLLGEEIFSVHPAMLSGKNFEIDCNSFSTGVYIVRVNSERLKLVIQ